MHRISSKIILELVVAVFSLLLSQVFGIPIYFYYLVYTMVDYFHFFVDPLFPLYRDVNKYLDETTQLYREMRAGFIGFFVVGMTFFVMYLFSGAFLASKQTPIVSDFLAVSKTYFETTFVETKYSVIYEIVGLSVVIMLYFLPSIFFIISAKLEGKNEYKIKHNIEKELFFARMMIAKSSLFLLFYFIFNLGLSPNFNFNQTGFLVLDTSFLLFYYILDHWQGSYLAKPTARPTSTH